MIYKNRSLAKKISFNEVENFAKEEKLQIRGIWILMDIG